MASNSSPSWRVPGGGLGGPLLGGSGGGTTTSQQQQQQWQQQQLSSDPDLHLAGDAGGEEAARRKLAECLEKLARTCRGAAPHREQQRQQRQQQQQQRQLGAPEPPADAAFATAASTVAAAAAAAAAAARVPLHGSRPKSSRFRGVSRYKRSGKWMASVHVPGEGECYLGTFELEEEAARARDAELRRRNLADRGLNFPTGGERPATAAAPASRGPRGTSRFRGISWVKQKRKWKAGLYVSGEKTPRFLGYHATEEDAARAYDAEVRRAGLSPAWLHFPSEGEAAATAVAMAAGPAGGGAPAAELAGLASFAAAAAAALQQLQQQRTQQQQ